MSVSYPRRRRSGLRRAGPDKCDDARGNQGQGQFNAKGQRAKYDQIANHEQDHHDGKPLDVGLNDAMLMPVADDRAKGFLTQQPVV